MSSSFIHLKINLFWFNSIFSSAWSCNCYTRTFQSMVLSKSVLFRINICGFTDSNCVCYNFRYYHLFDDRSAIGMVSIWNFLCNYLSSHARFSGMGNDYWRRLWRQSEWFFFINLKCWKKYQKWTDRKRPFLLLLACTCYWTICHCTILGIFWIFSTFFRCTSSITLAISYIVFEACARRICFSHIRLWSTENGMRWNVLSLSHTKEIYGNYWYARG